MRIKKIVNCLDVLPNSLTSHNKEMYDIELGELTCESLWYDADVATVLVVPQGYQRTMEKTPVVCAGETTALVQTVPVYLMVTQIKTSVVTAKKKLMQPSTLGVLHLENWSLLAENMVLRLWWHCEVLATNHWLWQAVSLTIQPQVKSKNISTVFMGVWYLIIECVWHVTVDRSIGYVYRLLWRQCYDKAHPILICKPTPKKSVF